MIKIKIRELLLRIKCVKSFLKIENMLLNLFKVILVTPKHKTTQHMSLKSKMLSSLSFDRSIKYLGNNDTETDEVDSDTENNIKVVDNSIFYYSAVNNISILNTISTLSKMIKESQMIGIAPRNRPTSYYNLY